MSSSVPTAARLQAFQLSSITEQPFDLFAYAPYQLAVVSNLLLLDRDPKVRALTSLNAREIRILLNIGSYGPVYAADIAYQSRLDPYSVSRAIKVLQQQQMIEPAGLSTGKVKPMILSKNGLQVYQRLCAELDHRANRLLQGVNKQEQQLLSRLLARLELNAEQMLAEHCQTALTQGERLTREQQEFIRWQQRSCSSVKPEAGCEN